VWEFATRDRVWATPVVVGSTVYIASMDHHLYAVDLQSGAESWRIKLDGAITATPLFVDGQLWLGDFASTFYRIDPATQTITWSMALEDWMWATPAHEGGTLYIADVAGSIIALDIRTLSTIWSASVGDVVRSRPALNEDGSLLFVAGYEQGKVLAVDTLTGNVRQSWGTQLQNPGRLPGDLVVDGERLYTMPILVEERVQAFGLVAGELLWTAPEIAE
jgi:eukaryotic-like serine/threonine-protein kinase